MVPVHALLPTRLDELKLTVPAADTTKVTLTDPVVGPFTCTRLLTPRSASSKLKARVRQDSTPTDVTTMLAPVSDPPPSLPRTLLDDTHRVLETDDAPLRRQGLVLVAAIDDTDRVTLTDPVAPALPRNRLLTPREASAKLTAWLRLVRTLIIVTTTARPPSLPGRALARTVLDDVHTVLAPALPPTRDRALRSTHPADAAEINTVTLLDPVVGPLQPMQLRAASDPPA